MAVGRMATLRSLYGRLRATTTTQLAFSLLVRAILVQPDRRLRHYCLALVYYVLEPGYLASKGTHTTTWDVDMSIKLLLTADETTSEFYGTLYPYFDPVAWVMNRLPGRMKNLAGKLQLWISDDLPEMLKFLVIVIVGE